VGKWGFGFAIRESRFGRRAGTVPRFGLVIRRRAIMVFRSPSVTVGARDVPTLGDEFREGQERLEQ
jgi:hypothetical protein